MSLRPGSLGFNPDTPRRRPFNSASDAFQLRPGDPARAIWYDAEPTPTPSTTTRAKIASDELRDALDAARRVCDAAERRSEASREALDRARELEASTTRLLAATSR